MPALSLRLLALSPHGTRLRPGASPDSFSLYSREDLWHLSIQLLPPDGTGFCQVQRLACSWDTPFSAGETTVHSSDWSVITYLQHKLSLSLSLQHQLPLSERKRK